MATVTARPIPTLASARTTRRTRATTTPVVPLARSKLTLPALRPLSVGTATRVSRRAATLVVKASSGSEEPQTDGEEGQVDISQFFGSYFFLAVFLGTMGLAAYASYKTALVDPSQVGILAGPPSAFAAVAVAFFGVKIVQNKQKQAKREAAEQKEQ